MKKNKLFERVKSTKSETREALQMVYNELNNGQKKKILKAEKVKALFERYGVEV